MNLPKSEEELLDFIVLRDKLDIKIMQIALLKNDACYDDLKSWDIDKDGFVYVTTEGWWSDGTHDVEYASFPVRYLFRPYEEVEEQIKIEKEKTRLEKEKKEKLRKEEALKFQEECEKAEYERLKAKFGDK